MVSVLAASAVDRGFEPRSGQTKDYATNMCCFSTKHAALRRKRKDWLAGNQDHVCKERYVGLWTIVSPNLHYIDKRIGLV